MYKMIVCDFDNVLIDDDFSIPISTVLTIDKLRRKNIKFSIITEKALNFIKYYIKDVNFIDYIISLDGSYIYDAEREKIIYEKKIKIVDIKKIINLYEKSSVKIYLYTDNSRCYYNINNEKTSEIVIRNLDDFLKNNKVYKIDIQSHSKKALTAVQNSLLKEKLDINIYRENIDDVETIGIVNGKSSKFIALNEILNRENISLNEVVYYTCNINDKQLIENVGLKVALENAKKNVKKECDKKTLSNNKKGVEKSLIELFKEYI